MSLIRRLEDLRKVMNYFLGDYCPLTPYSLDNTVWMAWQFDRPDLGEGVIQVFRRAESCYESAHFQLRGLESEARYIVTDLDRGGSPTLSGRQLAEKGLLITIPNRPSAAVVIYRQVQ